MAELAVLQTQMYATQHLKESRPKVKFSGGRKLDFAKHLKMLYTALDVPGVTTRQRVLELQHYFEGPAFQLIEAETLRDDANAAFETAIAKLIRKFGTRKETALEMLEDALQGKQVPEKDPGALLDFYTKLEGIYTLAAETKRAKDFETKTVVDTILKKKLPHMMEKWFKKVVKFRIQKDGDLQFCDFLGFLDEEHSLAEHLQRANGVSASNSQKTSNVKVASTTVSSTKKTSNAGNAGDAGGVRNPGSTEGAAARCTFCSGEHFIGECSNYKKMTGEARKAICMSSRLCFKCLGTDHAARNCKEKACPTCGHPHHQLLHDAYTAKGGPATAAKAVTNAVEVATMPKELAESQGGTA